ncbi:MAG: peptidylprolyl isomerase, partial [Victivallales bacterium]|nr:peptidylprolyl isomerase [Victivallales bacterium]
MDDLRDQAKERAAAALLINERCSKSVYITPKQVYDYYVANCDEFTMPARLKLQAILLRCAAGNSVVARFAERLKKTLSGVDEKKFADYASLYSQGPNHKNGGRVGWIPETELRPEFKNQLTGAKSGSIHGPIRTPEGIYFIRVMKRTKPKSESFDSVKKKIRNKLTEAAKKKKYKQYSADLRKFAVIRFFDKE